MVRRQSVPSRRLPGPSSFKYKYPIFPSLSHLHFTPHQLKDITTNTQSPLSATVKTALSSPKFLAQSSTNAIIMQFSTILSIAAALAAMTPTVLGADFTYKKAAYTDCSGNRLGPEREGYRGSCIGLYDTDHGIKLTSIASGCKGTFIS
jgi:hypothetical protein